MTTMVSTTQDLIMALENAQGGDVIVLAPGTYGSLDLQDLVFDAPVTVTNAVPENAASFTQIHIKDSSNIVFDGLAFDRTWPSITNAFYALLRIDDSADITVRGSQFSGSVVTAGDAQLGEIVETGVYVRSASGILVENNHFEGVHRGVSFGTVRDSAVRGNTVTDYREDGMSFSYIDSVVIERNIVRNPNRAKDDHLDYIQVRAMKDSIIRDNLLLQGDGEPSQGLFIKAYGAASINGGNLIENNIIQNGMRNGIYVDGLNTTVIRDNTLVEARYAFHTPNLMVLGDDAFGNVVTGNVASGFQGTRDTVLKLGGQYRANVKVEKDDPTSASHYAYVLQNGYIGGEAVAADFARIENGPWPHPPAGASLARFDYLGDAAIAPPPSAPIAVGFDAVAIMPYAAQDLASSSGVGAEGLRLSGNAWQALDIAVTLNERTTLSLDMTVFSAGEIYGIGFARDGKVLEQDAFRLAGDQNWGVHFYAAPAVHGETRSVTLDVGRFTTGFFNAVVLIADDDVTASADVVFGNLRFTDADVRFLSEGIVLQDHAALAGALRSYDVYGQNVGGVSFEDDAFTLSGNAWQQAALPFELDRGVVISGRLTSTDTGEIMGIGLLKDGVLTSENFIQLAGADVWGVQNQRIDAASLSQGGDFEIALDTYFSGAYDGFVFVADDDADASSVARFQNVTLSIDKTAPAVRVVPVPLTEQALGGFDDRYQHPGDLVVEDGVLTLSGNGWRALDGAFELSADTLLRFEFRAPQIGEIHAIGFETDDTATSTRFVQLAGAQDWGLEGYAEDTTEWREVELPVGALIGPGVFTRLVFVADDDRAEAVGVSQFRELTFEDIDTLTLF